MNSVRFNWKVLAIVAAVAIGLLIATQNAVAGVLPILLLVLICPLMMLFMMGSMGHTAGSDHHHTATAGDMPDLKGLTHDEQVRVLRGELTRMAWRQEALRRDLEQLEAERVADPVDTAGAR